MSYEDIKSYYQDEHKSFFFRKIEEYEKKKNIFQSVEIHNLEVKSVRFKFKKSDKLTIEVFVSISCNGQIKEKKYKIKSKLDFDKPELGFMSKTKVKECDSLKFHERTFYEEYGLIRLEKADLYGEIEKLKNSGIFNEEMLNLLKMIDGSNIINYEYGKFPETILGRIYLKEGKLKVDETEKTVKKNTIVINSESKYINDLNCEEFVKAHERAHFLFHRKYKKIRSLLDSDLETLDFIIDMPYMEKTWSNKRKADWVVEWQANMYGIGAIIPEKWVCEILDDALEKSDSVRDILCMPKIIEKAVETLASICNISHSFVKFRAFQLGYDMAAGTFISVDNQNRDPIYYPKGTLGVTQTFIIGRQELEKVCAKDSNFKEALDSGELIYLGYVVCKNDEKYIEKIEDDYEREIRGCGYKLTDYASAHADECCTIFSFAGAGEDDLEKEYSSYYLNFRLSSYENLEYYVDREREVQKEIERFRKEREEILKILESGEYQKWRTFSDLLKFHMAKNKMTISELEERTTLSSTIIKRYKKGAIPSLENLMAIFVALNLHEIFCNDMLEACGYKLSDRNEKSAIYKKLIREHSGENIHQWNTILRQAGYPILPNKKGQKNGEAEYSG